MFVQDGVRRNDSRSEESEEELSEGDLMQVILIELQWRRFSYVIISVNTFTFSE